MYFIMITNHSVLCHILQRPIGSGPWLPRPPAVPLFILPLQRPPWFLKQVPTLSVLLPQDLCTCSSCYQNRLLPDLLPYFICESAQLSPDQGVLQDYPIENNTPSSIFLGLLFFTNLLHTTLAVMLYTYWFKCWLYIYGEKRLYHCVSWA